MKINLYQVDAFAEKVFKGNPAAVCPLKDWLPELLMQRIAAENNLSETAFFVKEGDGYRIRWFTPNAEVDLCGHATLASSWVIFNILEPEADNITFLSRSGPLLVGRSGELITLDFPAQPPVECETPQALIDSLNVKAVKCLKNEDYIVVVEDERDVRECFPDMALLMQLDLRGVTVTAESEDYDFVCRFFAPKYGIDEDPVTGSAFTQLVPYWAGESGLTEFKARQISPRGGDVICTLEGDRVTISGKAVLYLKGEIEV